MNYFPIYKLEPNRGIAEFNVIIQNCDVPTLSNGKRAKFVHVRCFRGTLTRHMMYGPTYFPTALQPAEGWILSPSDDAGVVFDVTGFDDIALRDQLAVPPFDQDVSIVPLADF